jgi:hypothetical protein
MATVFSLFPLAVRTQSRRRLPRANLGLPGGCAGANSRINYTPPVCLSVLHNAVVTWNTLHICKLIKELFSGTDLGSGSRLIELLIECNYTNGANCDLPPGRPHPPICIPVTFDHEKSFEHVVNRPKEISKGAAA